MFSRTLVPTFSPASVKISVIFVRHKLGFKSFHSYVVQGFFLSNVTNEKYIIRPYGSGNTSDDIIRLNRSLRGKEQGGRQRGSPPAVPVVECGMDPCRIDPCVANGKAESIKALISGPAPFAVATGGDVFCDNYIRICAKTMQQNAFKRFPNLEKACIML